MAGISYTYIIIGITVLISLSGFKNVELLNRLLFYPSEMKEKGNWWQFITHGFVHADFQHLLFNMLTLFFFGPTLERIFSQLFESDLVFPLFYLAALIFSSVPSYFKHKNNYYYRALGASGAIAAVLFAAIMFDPWQTIGVNFFIPVPGILFAIGYIAYSHYMGKKGMDNIGHEAHLYGAIFGLICPIILKPAILPYFIEQLSHPRFLSFAFH